MKENLKGRMAGSTDLNHAKPRLLAQRRQARIDWTRVMMSEMRLTAWESSSPVNNRKAAEYTGKQTGADPICAVYPHTICIFGKSRGRQREKKNPTISSQKSQLYCTFSVSYYEVRATFIMKALFSGQKRWCKIWNHQCKHVDCPFTPVNVHLPVHFTAILWK